jgi:hypothetical protein
MLILQCGRTRENARCLPGSHSEFIPATRLSRTSASDWRSVDSECVRRCRHFTSSIVKHSERAVRRRAKVCARRHRGCFCCHFGCRMALGTRWEPVLYETIGRRSFWEGETTIERTSASSAFFSVGFHRQRASSWRATTNSTTTHNKLYYLFCWEPLFVQDDWKKVSLRV